MDVKVVRAEDADAAAITSLRTEAGWVDSVIEGEAWVVRERGHVVASLQLLECGGDVLLVDAVVTKESERGRGLGTALLRQVLASRSDADWWLECHEERIAFYGRLGFVLREREDLPPGVRPHIEEPDESPPDHPPHLFMQRDFMERVHRSSLT